MKNKDFDKILKDKISNDTNSSQADWDVFSQLLRNAEGFEDINFDNSIKEKVQAHRNNVNPDHWQSLRDRLEKEEKIRRRVFTLKSLELLALLFLFIGYQTYEYQKFQNTPFVFKFEEKLQGSKAIQSIKNIVATTLTSSPTALIAIEKVSEIFIPETEITDVVENSVDEPIYRNDFSEEYKNQKLINVEKITSLLTKDINSINKQVSNLNPEFIPYTSGIKPLIKEKEKFISGTFSTGIGITKSSFDRVYNLKAYEAYDNQYSVGILFGKKKNNFEVSTGIRYTRRANEPARVIETYGDFLNNYYEISLNKITYNIAEVPVNFKYFFDNKGKTNYYVKAGVNANLSLHNTYTITNKPKNTPSNALTNTISISDGDEIEGKAARSKLKQKDFSPGILNGGSFSDNYFMTASLEVGVERKLSKNNTLVLGAEYSKYYMIDGIGPNKEKLNNIALNLSLKHYIN